MIASSSTIYGCGQITGAFPNLERTVLAIASTFPRLTNPPGRAAYAGQQLRHRLGLYRRGERQPFATFDQLRFPINDVSFHPEDPVIAIGGGSYDGGWVFEGELILWDWSTGLSHCGAKQVPEVERCVFDASGTCLNILVRPWDEEWGADESPQDAFERLYPLRISYVREGGGDIEIDPHMWIERGQAQLQERKGAVPDRPT